MEEEEIVLALKEILAKALDTTQDKITEESLPQDFELWDSLVHMEIMVAVEKRFKISIPDEVVPTLLGFKPIKEYVMKNLRK